MNRLAVLNESSVRHMIARWVLSTPAKWHPKTATFLAFAEKIPNGTTARGGIVLPVWLAGVGPRNVECKISTPSVLGR